MTRKKLTIGLFGFGCVGKGLYEVLQKTPELKTTIKRICIKDIHKERSLKAHCFTFDKNTILNDPEINVIVELIDDADAAYEIVCKALKNGKAVVTANKKMIAEHAEELIALQKEYNTSLLYEAACCASIPIIRNLEEYYDNDLLESIEGIVNGSTNYILTQTKSKNISYELALQKAQEKGYVESNPLLDTGGYDAKYKLLILLLHAFGVICSPEDIFNVGIDKLSDLELNYAKEKGYKIKLVAFAHKTDSEKIISFVIPKFIKETDSLFHVDDVFNGIKTKSFFSDVQFFMGKGAGAYPTASAVLSDISALTYNYRYEYKKRNFTDKMESDSNVFLKILLRHNLQDSKSVKKYFIHISEEYSNHDCAYLIGIINLKNLKQLSNNAQLYSSTVLFDIVFPNQLNTEIVENTVHYEMNGILS